MDLLVFYLSKLIELAALGMMPYALHVGLTVPGGAGMVLQLKILFSGIILFLIGRTMEEATGVKD